jgi:hypothetical protein
MKNKNRVDQSLIWRLRAAGCPMPEDCEDDPMPGLVFVVSRPEITRAYVVPGCAEYVLALQITNRSYDCLEVQKFECGSYWSIRLIGQPSPQTCGPEKPSYRLPSGRTFPYESVLNHRTGRAGRLHSGDSMEGILLAYRCQPYPEECLGVQVIPVDLSIVDQYAREHVSEIDVTVDRTAIMNSIKPSRRQGRALYDKSESHTNLAVREQARRSVAAVVSSDIQDELVYPKRETYEAIPDEHS